MQKYEIMSAIGQGAYGVVLKCRDVETKTTVAIKKFKDTDDQQHTRKTTMRQVKILKMLNHPNIVQMKQAFRKKGIVFLVFEYVQNNLLEILQRSPNGLQLSIIRRLIFQLLKGLAYLHSLNIIHRDIKPQNLLVSNSYSLKICDFGFARLNKLQKGEKFMTDYVATRWYRPPQLLVGGNYSKQIDIWAVGCIMCQLIDGNPLFPGQNQLDQLFLIQKTLGQLIPDHHQKFIKNQRFLGMKFPQIQNLDPLQKKYFGKIDQKGMSFLKSILKMDPSQRLTANDALNHPFFQQQRLKDTTIDEKSEISFRKDIYTSTTNRKKDIDIDRMNTKYGKIYSKRKNNHQAIAMIYQSSNNCKVYNNNAQTKSLTKTNKKVIHQQQLSLEKHYNRDILRKTQANGFYIETQQNAALGFDSPTKHTQNTWQSTNQLPFLITHNPDKMKQKKTPQIIIQKQTYHINQIINGR